MQKFLAIGLLLIGGWVHAQTDSTVYVKQFPGTTVGEKIDAAQKKCSADSSCVVVIDASLASSADGTMPTPCTKCMWMDYRRPGALEISNLITRGPVVDVRSFGADPEGIKDSLPAVKSALRYINSSNITYPTLYFPAGHYIINGTIHIQRYLTVKGDGDGATVLQETNPTANLITVNTKTLQGANKTPVNSPLVLQNLYLEGSGHNTIGTLLELLNAHLWWMHNINMDNNGGRGIEIYNSERGHSDNLQIYNVRMPISMAGNDNELGFYNSRISGGETDNGSYSYNINAVHGAYPAPNAGICSHFPAWQANKPYPEGSLICDGTNIEKAVLSGYVDAAKGHYVNGISGSKTPAWSTSLGATTPDNGGGNDRGLDPMTTKPGITWLNVKNSTPLHVDYHPAVVLSGVNINWDTSSIKSTIHSAGIAQIGGGEGISIKHTYFECYAGHCPNPAVEVNISPEGEPVITSDLHPGDLTAPVSGADWALAYINDPVDIATINQGDIRLIRCTDYNPGSRSPSICGHGLLQNQQEVVTVKAYSGDGKVYFHARKQAGSNAPPNYIWPANNTKIVIGTFGAYGGGVDLEDNHMESAVVNTTSGYTTYAGDLIPHEELKEVLLGPLPDGKEYPYPGQSGFPSPAPLDEITMRSNALYGVARGAGQFVNAEVGCYSRCIVTSSDAPMSSGIKSTKTMMLQHASGVLVSGMIHAVYSPYGHPDMTVQGPGLSLSTDTSSIYGKAPNFNHAGQWTNIRQYMNSYCITDTSSSSLNPSIRHCYDGGPQNQAVESIQLYNGTSWVTILQITGASAGTPNASGTFALKGNTTIGGTLTVGGGAPVNSSNNLIQMTSTSGTGTCVQNGYVSVVVNGATLHLATCK